MFHKYICDAMWCDFCYHRPEYRDDGDMDVDMEDVRLKISVIINGNFNILSNIIMSSVFGEKENFLFGLEGMARDY